MMYPYLLCANRKLLKYHIIISLFICSGAFFINCDLLVWNGDPEPQRNDLSAKDSLAVRAILDANGLYNTEVRDVISLQSNRVGGISIDSLPITAFIFTNVIDTFVHGFRINIIDCPIDTIIIEDSIHENITIGIARTNLRSIPDNISLFTGNIYLYFGNNKIQYISPEIMKCDIGFIDLTNNMVCTVPDSLNNWLSEKRPGGKNWRSTQKCNLSIK